MKRLALLAVILMMLAVPGIASAQGNGQEREGHGGESFKMADLRDTICQPIDSKLGPGACSATVIFLVPMAIFGGMWVGGIRHPFALSGGAVVGMCGAAALVFPNVIMVTGFLIAAAGAGATMLVLKR